MHLGLVTNYGRGGGSTKREGGHVKFYPYENGFDFILAIGGGHKMYWDSFYTVA